MCRSNARRVKNAQIKLKTKLIRATVWIKDSVMIKVAHYKNGASRRCPSRGEDAFAGGALAGIKKGCLECEKVSRKATGNA